MSKRASKRRGSASDSFWEFALNDQDFDWYQDHRSRRNRWTSRRKHRDSNNYYEDPDEYQMIYNDMRGLLDSYRSKQSSSPRDEPTRTRSCLPSLIRKDHDDHRDDAESQQELHTDIKLERKRSFLKRYPKDEEEVEHRDESYSLFGAAAALKRENYKEKKSFEKRNDSSSEGAARIKLQRKPSFFRKRNKEIPNMEEEEKTSIYLNLFGGNESTRADGTATTDRDATGGSYGFNCFVNPTQPESPVKIERRRSFFGRRKDM